MRTSWLRRSRAARIHGDRALVDVKYWFALGNHVDRLEDRLGPWHRRIAARSPLARSALTAWLGRRYGLVVTGRAPRRALPLWTALLAGRRRLVYLNFHMPLPERPAPWFWGVQAPLLRWAVCCVQALSLHDCRLYADQLGLGAERVRYVPYAWRRSRNSVAHRLWRPAGRRVMASGYARCDWDTLFSAAANASWDLVVACGPADLGHVSALNRSVGADVRCDIPREEHTALLREADVYVIPVREDRISTGHVRLRDANEHGVAVVSAGIHAMREYVLDGITGLTYTPHNAKSLRAAVDRLLDDPDFAAQVARAAVDRSAGWDQSRVFIAQRAIIDTLLGHEPEAKLVHPPIEDAVSHGALDTDGFAPLDTPRPEA